MRVSLLAEEQKVCGHCPRALRLHSGVSATWPASVSDANSMFMKTKSAESPDPMKLWSDLGEEAKAITLRASPHWALLGES
jgi:hypothetical protein